MDLSNESRTILRMAYQLYESSRQLKECEVLLWAAINDQHASIQALQQKSLEMETFFENALDLMCFADYNGYFHRVNREWERVLGYTEKELNGQRFLDFVHPDDLPATLAVMSLLNEQKPVGNFINRYRCHDGSYRWIEWRAKPYGELIMAAASDITERVQAEHALRASEERYRTLVDISPVPISLTDLQGRFITVNPAGLQQLGFDSIEALQNSGQTSFDVIVEEDHALAIENALKTFENGAVRNIEYRLRSRDGRIHPVEISASVIRDPEGQPTAFIGISYDISERKRAERAQAQSLSDKNTLLRDLQHRIKNSLSLICSLIFLEKNNAVQDETRKALSEIYDRVTSLAGLYNILYASNSTQQLWLDQYLQQVAQSLTGSYLPNRQGVKLEMECDEILIDARQATPYGLILNELLTNALKYAFPGDRTGTIWVSLRQSNGQVVLQVADDGIGLPAAVHTENRAPTLGLQLVDLLVHQLHGSITCQPGERTLFTVGVPYEAVAAQSASLP